MNMINSINSKLTLFLVSSVCVCAFGLATSAYAASGGGGGFSAPSSSAPSIDPVAKYQEGIKALQGGENKLAEKAFRKVLRVNKKHAGSQFFLGVALFNQEKFKKASRPFKKALKYNADLVSAHGYLGVVYQKTNKLKKVAEQRAILLNKQEVCGDCEAKQKIANALLQIDRQTNTESDQSSTLIETNFELGDQRYIDAVSFINKGDYPAALRALNESAVMFGPHPDVLTYQGFANRKLGNYALALDFYRAALSIDKNHRGANEYLGEYYVELGRIDLALDQLNKLEAICNFGCEEAEELRRWIVESS